MNTNLFLVDAAAGTRKTFLYNTLIHAIRERNNVVIPLSFTGIAASLFPGGKTLHSAFSLPLDLNETSACGLKANHLFARKIKNASLIIIDKVSTYVSKISSLPGGWCLK